MATYRIYTKRSTIEEYEVEAKTMADAENMALTHLTNHYNLEESQLDRDGMEIGTPFTHTGNGDDEQEEFMSIEEA